MAREKKNPSVDLRNPMDVTEEYWIHVAYPLARAYRSEMVGKWMLFPHVDQVNAAWGKIRQATLEGRLGIAAKVATAKPNANAKKADEKLICVYTYSYEDKEDMLRVLQELRDMGFTGFCPYKTDNTTRAHEYAFNSPVPVSSYYARPGMVELRVPKGRE